MINITLPDGSVRQAADDATALDVARDISEGLARNVLAAEVDGEVRDAQRPLGGDVALKLLTWGDDDAASTMWHSGAHLMAEALEVHVSRGQVLGGAIRGRAASTTTSTLGSTRLQRQGLSRR